MTSAVPFPPPPFLAATLGDRRLRLGAFPNALVRSPDGALLAGDLGDWIVLLDADSREVLRWIPTPAGFSVERLAFAADGARLVAGGWRDYALVFDLATGAVLARVPLGRPQVIARDFSLQGLEATPDGARVFVLHAGYKLAVLDAVTPKLVLERAIGRASCVAALDRRRLVVGLSGARVVLVDVEAADKGRTVKMPASPEAGGVMAVAGSHDGTLVAVGLSTGELVLLDAAAGAVRASFRAAVGPVWCAAFSHDGTRVATGGAEPVLRVWDVAGALSSGAMDAKPKGARGRGPRRTPARA